MKRDFDEIRRILLECEGSDERWFEIGTLEENFVGDDELESKRSQTERYHLDLMSEAGLIRIENVQHPGIMFPQKADVMFEVTWKGHDFLDAIRDEKIWNKTKSSLAKVGGSATVDVIKAVATSTILSVLGVGG